MRRPTLSDGIVTVRPVAPADADAIFAACQERELHRWLLVLPYPYRRADAVEFIARSVVREASGEGYDFVAVADGRIAGALSVFGAEIGYWTAREARGRGLATRALILVRDWAHEALGHDRIELVIHPENGASRQVAVKAGFSDTGELRFPNRGINPGEHLVYAWSAA
jgi:RimJ/RimL family protein N-acetyltransferase